MPDNDDAVSDDFADVLGDDSNLGENSIQSGSLALAPKKAPSRTPSKPPSKAPSELSADGSLFASGSRPASRPASKAASIADDSFGRSNDALRAPPKANPLSAVASGARRASSRPSTAGSNGRPASPLDNTLSDDYADLLGPGSETSSTSLSRGLPSRSGSGIGAAAAAAATASGGGPRPPPSAPTSTRFSPAGSGAPTPAAVSRPESVSGYGTGSFAAGSHTGSFSLGATLAPPEASPSPRASGSGTLTPRTTTFAAGTGGGGGSHSQQQRSLSRSDKSRLSQVECHIPTPFELFRLYDADLNGRVTQEEFISMLRDLDGHPLHYAPHDDPEHRLVRLREKRARKDSERAAREEKLSLAEMHRQATGAAKEDMAEEIARLVGKVAELDVEIAEEAVKARALVNHPDAAQRVTGEVRQHRVQWRKWVQEEFTRADLAGNNILSIDEFYMYFYSKLCFRFPVMRTGVNPGALLFNVFVRYCSIGRGAVGGRNEDMLSHQFAKLCKDAGLITGKTVTKAGVDIIYHRARAADENLETYKHKAGVAATARMYYPQFLFALDKLADKRRSGFQEVVARVLSSIDTLPGATFADFVIISGNDLGAGGEVPEFLTRHPLLPDNSQALRALADNDMIRKMKEESHDALSLSMGQAPKSVTDAGLKSFLESKRDGEGGAKQSNGDGGGGAGGSGGASVALQASVYGGLAPPSLEADALRQKKWERREPGELERSRAAALAHGVTPVLSPNCMHMVRGLDPDQLMASLKRVYEAYTAWGGGVDRAALDRRRFSKALRDALLISESGSLPTRKAEAVYDKILPASCRALNFIQFIEALRHVALHHRLSLNEVMEKLVAVGSPRPGP